MRKLIALGVCMVVGAPLAFGQTNVLSQNAVGYVKVTIDKGDLALLRNDFENIDGSPVTLDAAIGTQAPNSSAVFYWNRGTKAWDSSVKGSRGWAPNFVLNRGDGFFLQINPAAALPSYDVFLDGEVPSTLNGADSSTVANVAADAIGYPYPAATTISATDVGTQAASGDGLYLWNQGSQAWASAVVKGSRGWPGDPAIAPGQGFFITVAAGPIAATDVKPYSWP